jgi:hypothetical protein
MIRHSSFVIRRSSFVLRHSPVGRKIRWAVLAFLAIAALGPLLPACKSKPDAGPAAGQKEGRPGGDETRVVRKGDIFWEGDPAAKGNIWRGGASDRPVIGSHNENAMFWYTLDCDFGLEQWENGKRSSQYYQRWSLKCQYPTILTHKTECSLERLVITDAPDQGGATFFSNNYSTEDNSLKLTQTDWEKGILDFQLLYADQSTTEVALRFSQDRSTLFLESFRAVSRRQGEHPGEVTTVEHRISEYTFQLYVPLLMKGLHDAGIRPWDRLFAALSPADQAAWKELNAGHLLELDKALEREAAKKLVALRPGVDFEAFTRGKVKLSAEDQRLYDRIVREVRVQYLTGKISVSRLSADAKRKISDYVSANY